MKWIEGWGRISIGGLVVYYPEWHYDGVQKYADETQKPYVEPYTTPIVDFFFFIHDNARPHTESMLKTETVQHKKCYACCSESHKECLEHTQIIHSSNINVSVVRNIDIAVFEEWSPKSYRQSLYSRENKHAIVLAVGRDYMTYQIFYPLQTTLWQYQSMQTRYTNLI